jgi:hypothetical protein
MNFNISFVGFVSFQPQVAALACLVIVTRGLASGIRLLSVAPTVSREFNMSA